MESLTNTNALVWIVGAVVVSAGFTSLLWWVKCDEKSSQLKWVRNELNERKIELSDAKEELRLAGNLRAMLYKEFTIPAADAIKKALLSGKVAPMTQVYDFLGTLLPFWTMEGPSPEFTKSIEYLKKFDGAKFHVTWVWDGQQLVILFKLWATEKTEEPFKVTREFDLPS